MHLNSTMSKPHLLFLHGALGSKQQFQELTTKLSDSFTCHAINLPGHGGELIPPGGLGFDGFASAILAYLNKENITSTHLMGFSMGGYAALYFAHKHPNRVNKILTLNVKFNWDPISTAKETGMLDPDKMMEKIPGYANNLILQHGMNLWKNLLAGTSEMMKKLAETVVLSEAELAEIKHPVLLGIGDRDKTSSVAETIKVFSLLPDARLWVLPDTGHPFEKIPLSRLETEIRLFF